jgi:hypothetical protein
MKHAKWNLSGALLSAAAGTLALLLVAGPTPAAAQASDAADRCTPDVMRLCSEHVPDADRIVQCLKVKRKQLSPSCASALQPQGGSKSSADSKSSNSKSSNSKSSSSNSAGSKSKNKRSRS